MKLKVTKCIFIRFSEFFKTESGHVKLVFLIFRFPNVWHFQKVVTTSIPYNLKYTTMFIYFWFLSIKGKSISTPLKYYSNMCGLILLLNNLPSRISFIYSIWRDIKFGQMSKTVFKHFGHYLFNIFKILIIQHFYRSHGLHFNLATSFYSALS